MSFFTSRRFRLRWGVLAIASIAATPLPALSQGSESGADESFKLEEIIVTARKREESLQKVPSSISAVTGEGLEEIGATSFADYAGTVPGLLFQDAQIGSSGRGQNAVIRGVTTSLSPSGFQSTVAVYLDDIPLQTFFDPDVAGIQRVEVLRGPQGTLYGDRSMGGAIRYITAEPSISDATGSITLGVGETDNSPDTNHRLRGSVNMPLSNRSAFLLVGSLNNRGGYVDSDGLASADFVDAVDTNFVEKGFNTRDVTQLRGKFLLEATDDLEFLVTGYYEDNDIGGGAVFDPTKPEFRVTNLFGADTNSRETSALNLRIRYDLGWGELYSSSSYLDDETQINIEYTPLFSSVVEFFASNVSMFFGGGPIDFREPIRGDERVGAKTLTQEIRLSSSNNGNFNYLVGLYYTGGDNTTIAPIVQPGFAQYNTAFAALAGFTGDGTDVAYNFSGATETSELAVFGEARFDLADDKLQLTFGGRFFDYENIGFGSTGIQNRDASENGSIFRASLAWFPNDYVTVFGQVSEGYRAGAGNTPIPDPPANFGDVDADTLINYEIGVKFRTPNNRFSAALATYLIDWENIQTTFFTPGGFFFLDNAGAAETSGIEFEFASNPFRNAIFSGSIAYLSAEISEAVPALGIAAGQRLPATPEYTASLHLRERFSINDNYSLEPGVFWTYRDESFTAFGEGQGQLLDSYSRLNVSVLLNNEASNWNLRLFADNVTNETPVVGVNNFRSVPQVSTIRPQTIGLTFSKDFN